VGNRQITLSSRFLIDYFFENFAQTLPLLIQENEKRFNGARRKKKLLELWWHNLFSIATEDKATCPPYRKRQAEKNAWYAWYETHTLFWFEDQVYWPGDTRLCDLCENRLVCALKDEPIGKFKYAKPARSRKSPAAPPPL
jgi:hypothetical protein